jgi:hypothetical protein
MLQHPLYAADDHTGRLHSRENRSTGGFKERKSERWTFEQSEVKSDA